MMNIDLQSGAQLLQAFLQPWQAGVADPAQLQAGQDAGRDSWHARAIKQRTEPWFSNSSVPQAGL